MLRRPVPELTPLSPLWEDCEGFGDCSEAGSRGCDDSVVCSAEPCVCPSFRQLGICKSLSTRGPSSVRVFLRFTVEGSESSNIIYDNRVDDPRPTCMLPPSVCGRRGVISLSCSSVYK